MEDEFSYKPHHIIKSAEIKETGKTLIVTNNDFNNRGTVSIYIKHDVGGTASAIGFTIDQYDQLISLLGVFREVDDTRCINISTSTELFSIVNKKIEGVRYIIDISKLSMSSSGRSRTGLSISINKEELIKIRNVLIQASGTSECKDRVKKG